MYRVITWALYEIRVLQGAALGMEQVTWHLINVLALKDEKRTVILGI
jgi:hypothetical protein